MNEQSTNTNNPETKDQTNTNHSPEAIMLLSSHCAHCPGVLDSLSKLIKSGEIGSLNVINLEQHPEAMKEYNVRSVPWVRIGKHELTGAQTIEALRQRAEWALKDMQTESNLVADFDFLLSEGQASKVTEAILKDNSSIDAIMELLGDSGTVLSTRIGIGVVFEDFAKTELIKSLIPKLEKLTQHDDVRIRADAFHYLGMTDDKQVIPILESGLNDNDKEVREIAADSLEEFKK